MPSPTVIPFIKAHAVGNDFLIVEWPQLSALGLVEADLPRLASQICERHFGVGADGLEVLEAPGSFAPDADTTIRIFNADGSEAEISGNGTRCVAAFLVAEGKCHETAIIATQAGVKEIRLIERKDPWFLFDMSMGRPEYSQDEVDYRLQTELGEYQVTLLNVGNPQCVLMVDGLPSDWRQIGRVIEAHDRFPAGTNVSFVKRLDDHNLDVRFWERGAGETVSSGTGSTGAAVAAILLGQAQSPVAVSTPAGQLRLTWNSDDVVLRGPAEITAHGEYRGYQSAS